MNPHFLLPRKACYHEAVEYVRGKDSLHLRLKLLHCPAKSTRSMEPTGEHEMMVAWGFRFSPGGRVLDSGPCSQGSLH